jgi:hypothetical protein
MKNNKKDSSSSSILYNQATTTRTDTAAPDAVSGHCYSEENLLSIPLSKCNHKYLSGIAQSSKLICDTCNEIIGEWKFHLLYDVKKISFSQSQYLIYKIYPYLRRLTVEEVQDLV